MDRIPADGSPSDRTIANLIAAYAELVDQGDFAGVGDLLADAVYIGASGTVSGRDDIEKLLRDHVIVYDDGTPRTKHLITNVAIEVDDAAGTAVARCYFTALQRPPGLPLQPIVSGRYQDPLRAPRREMALCRTTRSNRPRRGSERPSEGRGHRPVG
jgi:SnoaL-like domain